MTKALVILAGVFLVMSSVLGIKLFYTTKSLHKTEISLEKSKAEVESLVKANILLASQVKTVLDRESSKEKAISETNKGIKEIKDKVEDAKEKIKKPNPDRSGDVVDPDSYWVLNSLCREIRGEECPNP